MFNLEKSISEWRQQMIAAGIKSPVPLEELEIHLREEIERQMKSGLNEQEAFEISVRQIGQPGMLNHEFKKSERKNMKRISIISAGMIGVTVGMGLVMPAVALYRNEGSISGGNVALLLLGIAMTLGGAVTSAFGFKRRKA